jgi:tripartite-type tricarboxylate transporter receptor subunit TctC
MRVVDDSGIRPDCPAAGTAPQPPKLNKLSPAPNCLNDAERLRLSAVHKVVQAAKPRQCVNMSAPQQVRRRIDEKQAALDSHGGAAGELRGTSMTILQRFAAVLLAAALSAALAPSARADDYPVRPVRIIAPFGAGGPADIYTRVIAQELEKALKQPFVVENRPGAGTTIGTEVVTQSAPDGYTLLVVSGTQTVNETLYTRKNYKLMRDLMPIAPIVDSDLVLVVNPKVPANNLKELLALARKEPGVLNFGSSGPGSNYHMAAELLKNLTGINIVHVPYRGSSGMRTDILSGQIQMLFDSVPTMAPWIKAGKVRAMGTSGTARSPILPDVPTIAEAGVPGFQATLWVGLMAPKKTPQPIVALLNREVSEILRRPAIKASWEKQGATPFIMSQPQFASFMQAQVDKWAKVIQENHIALIH